ncbi:MAG: YgjV family protein [Lachnospiraceae bacterium]|nr:YgjV family protein [Lachnospiraceae bacterium]
MIQLIANIIDLAAAFIQVGSGVIRQKTRILVIQILQLLMQAVSMVLLGGITGAVNNLLSCCRNYLCYKEKLSAGWKAFFITASIGATILLNKQGLLGLIPAAVCTVYILCMDVKDQVLFKLLVTVTSVPWILYHFLLGSYTGAFFDTLSVLTNAYALFKMWRSSKFSARLRQTS